MSLIPKTAVAGTGCLCACGSTVKAAFKGCLDGTSNFVLPSGRVESTYKTKYPVFLVPQEEYSLKPENLTFSQYFFIKAAEQAFLQAGIKPEQLNLQRVGVIIGASVFPSFHCFEIYKNWKNNQFTAADGEGIKTYLSSPLAQWVSNYYGFKGPFQTVVTACASGTDAVGLAKNWIETGLCDAVLCGGTDEIAESPYDGFIRLLVANEERCRPFCKTRKGINLGEGAAALLLVSQEILHKFNIVPKGYVLGYGNTCDAYHPTAPDPQAYGLKKALAFAVKESGLKTEDLAFINAHGTASPANDSAEALAFNEVLPDVPVWGSKGTTGHTLGAAGALEAVLTLEALNTGILPVTNGFTTPDESLNLIPTVKNTKITKRFAVSDSLAFGGCNAAVVLGAYNAY